MKASPLDYSLLYTADVRDLAGTSIYIERANTDGVEWIYIVEETDVVPTVKGKSTHCVSLSVGVSRLCLSVS